MELQLQNIPKKYDFCYIDTLGDYSLVYSPLSEKGLIVLNKESAWVFAQIDNKKSLSQILKLAQNKYKHVEFSDLRNICQLFLNCEIIYFNSPKTFDQFINKQSDQFTVWLHLTNQCNLRCTYCYVSKTSQQMSLSTAKKAITKLIHNVKLHKFTKIKIKFSGGECLLELKKLLQIVTFSRKLAKDNNVEIEFVVLTNGVLVNHQIALALKQQQIRVVISLDGLEKYHDKQRIFPSGKGSFAFVEKGIKTLQQYKIPFNVSVTITNNNIPNIPALTKYLLDKDIPFTFNFFRENPNVSHQLENNNKKLIRYMKAAYKLIADRPPRYSLINGLLDRVTFKKPHIHTCGIGRNYVAIRHDGKIVSCQMTLQNPIGSISNSDIIDTIKDGNFLKPKELTVLGKSPCHMCQWRYICCGGCPLLTYLHKGKYNLNSPYCEVYKALIPEVFKVEAKRLIKYGNYNTAIT